MINLKYVSLFVVLVFFVSCSSSPTPDAPPAPVSKGIHGEASWYGPGFHGRLTANGERFDKEALTAAHPSLPFNTRVRVTNKSNRKSVVVRINDRGPFAGDRIIDLSQRAGRVIGIIHSGVGSVKLDIL